MLCCENILCSTRAFDIPFLVVCWQTGISVLTIFAWQFSTIVQFLEKSGAPIVFKLQGLQCKRSKSNLKLGLFRELSYILGSVIPRGCVIHAPSFFCHDKCISLGLGLFL